MLKFVGLLKSSLARKHLPSLQKQKNLLEDSQYLRFFLGTQDQPRLGKRIVGPPATWNNNLRKAVDIHWVHLAEDRVKLMANEAFVQQRQADDDDEHSNNKNV